MRDYFVSAIWLLALFIFAYSQLMDAALDSTVDFNKFYLNNQSTNFAIFSNCGYLAITFLDYFISDTGKVEMRSAVIVGVIEIVLVFVIGGLAYMQKEGEAQRYYILKDYPEIIYYIHAIYLLLLFYLKKKSIQVAQLTKTTVHQEHNKIQQQ